MKLSELNPRWFSSVEGRSSRHGQGISFDCPGACCAGKLPSDSAEGHRPDSEYRSRLAVAFANPLDGGAPIGLGKMRPLLEAVQSAGMTGVVTVPPGFLWQRSGSTFDDLTLSPSVDASGSGHWHGWVQAGEAR